MNEDQFEKFMNLLAGRQQDHDLLIEIKTMVHLNAQTYKSDSEAGAKTISVLDRSITAAHKRLDFLFGGVLLTVAGTVIAVVTFFFTHKSI